jgi:hypothetical protein
MSDDELQRLRTMLASAHQEPRRKGFGRVVHRLVGRWFETPKNVAAERPQKNKPKKDVA